MPKLIKRKAVAVVAIVALCMVAAIFTANAQPFDPNTAVYTSQNSIDTTNRGRAPEPSTIALMLSGFIAALVRFARRRFDEFKRGFDIVVSIVGLIVSFPILLISILILKVTSHGPALFRQTRVGMNGYFFDIFKLRTMVVNAESQTGPVWARENDPR
ncbi:MAG: sugar transferase, partial [Candidatus Omnitrophota bacterium]